jgi:hypothetical protein
VGNLGIHFSRGEETQEYLKRGAEKGEHKVDRGQNVKNGEKEGREKRGGLLERMAWGRGTDLMVPTVNVGSAWNERTVPTWSRHFLNLLLPTPVYNLHTRPRIHNPS